MISVSLGIMFSAALLAFIVDPHYRYRKPFFYDTVYYEVYATAPHFLKNEDYDTLMLGTSMVRNFFINEINDTFSGNAIKLAAAGGTPADLKKFFDIALESRKDKLKQVVLSLDVYSLNKSSDEAHYKEFEYMYLPSLSEEYRYFFSRQTFSNMIYLLKRKMSPKRHRKYQTDRNRMFSNDYEGKKYGLTEVLLEAAANEFYGHTPTPYDEKLYNLNMKENILPVIDNNPQIKFTVYFPPYHIYCWCLSERFEQADGLLKQRTMVAKELLKRKNVVLHDLQSAQDIVCNDEYFNDTQHFSFAAGSAVLEKIKSGKYIVAAAADAEKNEDSMRKLIKEYMPQYIRQIDELKSRR
ncbi:MAG: hypothetical protein IJC27_05640 [Lentisphaeria bacterium]|nr:hypothetical protein [Lentisphaeria bacterium]